MNSSKLKCALCFIVSISLAVFALWNDDIIVRNLLLALSVIAMAFTYRQFVYTETRRNSES